MWSLTGQHGALGSRDHPVRPPRGDNKPALCAPAHCLPIASRFAWHPVGPSVPPTGGEAPPAGLHGLRGGLSATFVGSRGRCMPVLSHVC